VRSPRAVADVLVRAWRRSQEHNLSLLAAGVAFFGFLALFPALIAAATTYGLVSRPDDVTAQVRRLAAGLPDSSQQVLASTLKSLHSSGSAALTVGLVIALAGAIWATSGGVANLVKALNVAYGTRDGRGFLRGRLLALGLTVFAIVFVLLAVALITVVPVTVHHLGLDAVAAAGAKGLRWVLLILLALGGLAVLYRVAPGERAPHASWASLGAVTATVTWVVASAAFSLYVSHFGSYNKTYGALAGVVVLLLWLYLTCFIVLFGAEINGVMTLDRRPRDDALSGVRAPVGSSRGRRVDADRSTR
jgi:membrane protein